MVVPGSLVALSIIPTALDVVKQKMRRITTHGPPAAPRRVAGDVIGIITGYVSVLSTCALHRSGRPEGRSLSSESPATDRS